MQNSVRKSGLLPFFGNFEAGTLPLKFSIEIRVPEKEIFSVQDWKLDGTDPKILCLKPPFVMGNFNSNLLA